MILFPNCKINLGLHILRKRDDGFHDLETVFHPVPLQDGLEIVQHPAPAADVAFSASGLPVAGNPSDNICVKAYRLLKADFPNLPAVKMHLHKTIPMGAGLGGGSADGAFALVLLNKKFNLELSDDSLIAYALRLGSDCPFFIRNRACYATGRGEKMEDLPLDLSAYKLVLVNPQIHVATGWAFSQIKPVADRPSLKEIIQKPVADWKELLKNDFEQPVFAQYPAVKDCKDALYAAGAVYAAMSGSGATVFGLFAKETEPALDFPPDYFIKTV